MERLYKIRLKKGDKVIVRSGKEKGKTGTVLATHPRLNKVTVEGINVAKRHVKPTQKAPQGGIQEITRPIAVAKVGLVHPTDTKKATRIKMSVGKDGAKTRLYAANGKEVK